MGMRWCPPGLDAAGEDPVFQRRITDAELFGGLAGRQKGRRTHAILIDSCPLYRQAFVQFRFK